MQRNAFLNLINERVLFLDGAYGTEFFKRGYINLPGELLNIKIPEVVEELHFEYVNAGADILLTNTFNANRAKLTLLGYEEYFELVNQQAVLLARKAAKDKTLVFGNISSMGSFLKPLGDWDFYEAVKNFKEQAQILYATGVDGFLIETISDIKELKAAVFAIRSITTELPLIVHMTFEASQRTVTGSSIKIFASVFEDLDVDVLGINCTLGPAEMLAGFQKLTHCTTKHLSVEPNAGEPIFDGKKFYYQMSPECFASFGEKFLELGANIIGGCCGTSPKHIKLLQEKLSNKKPKLRKIKFTQVLTSRTIISDLEPFAIIGERINPASRKKFQQEIIRGDLKTVIKEANVQADEGARILDLNLGSENLLTEEHFREAIKTLDTHSNLPLALDIQTDTFLEAALEEYPGRPIINSAIVAPDKLENRIKLLKKFGGMLILLAMDNKLPTTPFERFQKIIEGITLLEEKGISRERILADPLVLALGSNNDPKVTLETIHLLTQAGIKTIIGLSNLSYGMPHRSYINGAFLAQSLGIGLSAAILNPGDRCVMGIMQGALTLKGKYLKKNKELSSEDPLIEALLKGETIEIDKLIKKELEKKSPVDVSHKIMGQALEEIGILYTAGKIFLPDLLLATATAEPFLDYLSNLIPKNIAYIGKVILATVEGDVHDIGKKIIGLMLKGRGFQVIDLGEDLPATQILEKIREEKPDIVGLSAMMTTTVTRIREVADLLKKNNMDVKLIAGGASMNLELAIKMGCYGYANNAPEAVKLCKKIIQDN